MFNNDGDLNGFENFRPPSSSHGRSEASNLMPDENRRYSSTPICSSREFDPQELLARLRKARNKTQPTQRASCNRTPIPTGPQPSAGLKSMRNSIIDSASLRNMSGNPGSRVIPRASCRRETSVIRERLGEPPLAYPRKFGDATIHKPSVPLFSSPTPAASSPAPSPTHPLPVSALQAAFERQQNRNKCSPALSQQPQSTATCNRLAVPSESKFPPRSVASSTPKPMAVVAPSPSTSPSISPSPSPIPSCSANPSTDQCLRCRVNSTPMREDPFNSQVPTLTTSVTSFMVPESVGSEICIKTPVQVEIVKSSKAYGVQKTLQDVQRRNSHCPVHHRPSMDRFKYTEYAKVHELNFNHNNCTRGLSTMRHGPGAPNLCGRCVPPPPQRRSISMAPPRSTPGRAEGGCSIGVRNGCGEVKSYEDIIRECEEKFAKGRRSEEKNCQVKEGKEEEKTKEALDKVGEEKKEEKSNFMSMIKDFTNALGGGEKAPPESPKIGVTSPRLATPQPEQMERKPSIAPSIVVTPPTPERETVPVPIPRTVEPEPPVATAAFGNFSRPLVGSTPAIVQNSEAIPKIVISDWDVPKIVLEEGQQERLGLNRSNITPSDCGFCSKLGDLWQNNK